MTVNELRAALRDLPDDLPVVLNNDVVGDYVDLQNPRRITAFGFDAVIIDSGEVWAWA